MEKREFELFTEKEERFLKFFVIPEEIFQEKFQELDSRSILLYGHFIRRMRLSRKNGWIDDQGHVFIYFTIQEACRILHICKDTAIKTYKALEKYGLLTKKRQGLGKPDMLYVHNVTQEKPNVDEMLSNEEIESKDAAEEATENQILKKENICKRNNYAPRIKNAKLSDSLFLKIRNYRLQEVDNIATITKERNIKKQTIILTKEFMDNITRNDSVEACGDIYSALKQKQKLDEQLLEAKYSNSDVKLLKNVINSVVSTPKPEYCISGKCYSSDQVQNCLRLLTQEQICAALDCLKLNRGHVRNEHRYLFTVLLRQVWSEYPELQQNEDDVEIQDSFEMEIVKCLVDTCRKEFPESRNLPRTEMQYQVWMVPVHQLILAGYSETQIRIAMNYAVTSEFWRPHIRTTMDFKNKFDKLYLLGIRAEKEKTEKKKNNSFNNFEPRNYDLESLEKSLLGL